MSRMALPQTNRYVIAKDSFKRDFQIPKDWLYPKFSEVVKVNPQTKLNSKKVLYTPMDAVNIQHGSIDYFEERNIDENFGLPRFVNNDVLFARITPSTENGKICIVENFKGEGIASSELIVLRPTDKVIPRYLYYFVQSHRIKKFAISQMMGTTGRQRVPDRVFKKDLNFELPPLVEQQRVISILSKVDKLIKKTNQIIGQTQRLKKGLMQRLLTRGIGHTKFKSKTLGLKSVKLNIPTDWSVVNLDSVVELRDTPHYTSIYFSSGIPVIRTSDCQSSGEINYSNTKFTSDSEYEKRRRTIDPEIGDVLYTREAPPGIASIVDRKKISIGQRIVLLKPQRGRIRGEFLVLFLNSKFGLLQSNGKIVRTTVEHVNIEDIRKFQVLLPSIQEQNLIIIKYNNVGNKIFSLNRYFGLLLNLKKALMQQLLTGKIRVKV